MFALVPAVLGLLASGYLTVEHFTSSTTFACPESATVNCQKVTTSSYSHVLGVPVALAGLLYFVVMVALVSPPAQRVVALHRVPLLAAAAGVVAVLYLIWAELFRIDAICLWCTVVHVCTVWLFGAVLWYAPTSAHPDTDTGPDTDTDTDTDEPDSGPPVTGRRGNRADR